MCGNSELSEITEAAKKYQKLNNALPDRILIYRDGVGDGQIPYVHEHEVKAILVSIKLE